jgi:hypothetical protein
MIFGHGSPTRSRAPRLPVALGAALPGRLWLLALILLLGVPAGLPAETMRIRVEWGGETAKQWEGRIAVSHGIVADPAPLGIEADEPGSIWLKDGALLIGQRSPRPYDGVDITVTAGLDQSLLLEFGPPGSSSGRTQLKFNLGDLVGDLQSGTLDNRGNRVLVRRAPGDKLAVSLRGTSLVFAPGESMKFEVRPNLLRVSTGTRLRITAQLSDARAGNLWSAEQTLRLGEVASIPLEIPLPNQEGVYDLVLAATPLGWQHAVRSSLGAGPIAERKIQLLVLGPQPPRTSAATAELKTVVEIDPASPHWWDPLAKLPQLPALARLRRGPLGNDNLRVRQHPLGSLAELNPSRAPDLSWEAYSLPINRPGVPHVLEVDYPSDAVETLGISIIEPNAAGAVAPIGLDSGFDQAAPPTADSAPPHWNRHRLIFWPRTRTPLVLITNRSDRQPALYGKLRVLAGWEQLPRAFPAQGPPSQRFLVAYLDRPLFAENFSASQALDTWSRSLQDWGTFYEGGTRLVEYLNHVGYDGLMISVLADGSAVYPSALLEATPRYDTGVHFDTGQDPIRKDVLEMLLRLFDRDGLRLIPALDFAAPLPRLEEIRRRGAEADGLEWVGPDGLPWPQVHSTRRGTGAYYNVLDPRVQQAMLAVVHELVNAYARHPSFAGLGLQLSADGYAQLPGPEWGMDDATIARFQQGTRLKVPGEGPGRFAERAQFLNSEQTSRAWIQWRADQLHQFFGHIQAELAHARPDGRLYLAGANMFSRPETRPELRPALPRRATVAESLLLTGIDVRQYQDDQGMVLLRCAQTAPQECLAAQAVNLEIQQMPDWDRAFLDLAVTGSLFYHPPQRAHPASFDQQSPLRPTYCELIAQLVPSDRQNRQRFIHELATLDSRLMFDGGALLPLGQEHSIHDLLAVYRRLPAARFQRLIEPTAAESSQPVTIRYYQAPDRTYVYLVNDAPFGTSVRIRIDHPPADGRVEDLSGQRPMAALSRDEQGSYWTAELEPYDLVAVSLAGPAVGLSRPAVRPMPEVEEDLTRRIRALGSRAALLRNMPPLDVLRNPGFELSAGASGQLPGWTVFKQPGVTMELDSAQHHDGKQSIRLVSSGPPGRLASELFSPPSTGRLALSVWMRLANPKRQPPLRVAVKGRCEGADCYRFAVLGAAANGNGPVEPITAEWAQYVFTFNDLPLQGLGPLVLWFDLLGPGEVWIDDVQVFGLNFTQDERFELSKLIALADVKLQNGRISDCLHLLEGYWPRFLEANVPLSPGTITSVNRSSRRDNSDAQDAKPERASLLDRLRDALPGRLRF